MGTITLQLPAGLPREAIRELERTCLAGGPDNMPWHTSLRLRGNILSLQRQSEESSGYLVAPWPIPEFGQLMGTSATLADRATPYHMLVELARGKINQVRCQAADWQAGGLQLGDDLASQIDRAAKTFCRAVCSNDVEETYAGCWHALTEAYQAAHLLVQTYITQVFHIRHQRQDCLDTSLACRPGSAVTSPALAAAFCQSFNRAQLPIPWHQVEADETVYRWGPIDQMLEWAETNDLEVTAGPLVDFSSAQLPAWLWLWERDVPSIAAFMCKFVEVAVRRYRSRIRRWQLTAASNWASVLSLTEDELMGLTFRLGETARQVDPALELVVGISQPWGEYMAASDRTYSPFIFADNLIRSGLNLAALDLEVVMGVNGRGSYCRDLLETSRLLDLYALLGVPLQVTLGYPSSGQPDPDADPDLSVGAGTWRTGYSPELQSEWAAQFTALALCKPYVQSVQWAHLADSDPHQFPACGLFDRQGNPTPALSKLQALRQQHLR